MRGAIKIIVVFFTLCLAALPSPVRAESGCVPIKFEVNGKEVAEKKFKILIYADNQTIEPELTENGFIVPAEIKHYKEVSVRFISGDYDLYFSSVNSSDFDSEW